MIRISQSLAANCRLGGNLHRVDVARTGESRTDSNLRTRENARRRTYPQSEAELERKESSLH